MDKNTTFSLFLNASINPERVVWVDNERKEWGTKSLYIRSKDYSINKSYKNIDSTSNESIFELDSELALEFNDLEEGQFLLTHNITNLRDLLNHINKTEKKLTSIKDVELTKDIKNEITNCKIIKNYFIDWFRLNNYENELLSILNNFLPKQTLKKKDAVRLLRKLEDDKYGITDDDKRILNHSSFKRYRSEHIKKLVKGSFFRAVRDLLDNGRLAYEDFEEITKPTSNWYRQKFIESFNYHCTNPKGQFYEQCQGKEFKTNAEMRNKNTGEKEICFFCK